MSRNPAPQIISTVVSPAAALYRGGQPIDLVSLADVKLELKIDGTADDLWLRKQIAAHSRAAARYCNRVFQVQTYQDLVWAPRDPYPWQVPHGFEPLQLAHWPIASPPSPALAAPPPAPVLSAVAGGSIAAGLAYVRATYVSPYGETAASIESEYFVPASSLISAAAPGPDKKGIATGWNVYAGSAPGAETLQNIAPLGLDTPWTAPASGFAAGNPPPACILAVDNVQAPAALAAAPLGGMPVTLAEGVDFIADRALGPLTRLGQDGYVRQWPALPLLIQYQAGFAAIPDDVQEAVTLLVKMHWFSRQRDPLARSQSAPGVFEQTFVMGTGPGGPGDMSADAAALLDRYRVPVIA